MLDNEKLLFDELYEKTKDCGRVQFVKLLMTKERENEELKRRLNWIAFGDDSELALRYLRKIGYVDFDDERKVYINKHNNEPFWLDDEEEKSYYIKDEELNEYTKDLEYQNQQKEFINYLEKKISAYAKAKPFFVEHIQGSYNLT